MNKVDLVLPPGPHQHERTRRHYIDHMAPVWFALPVEIRGEFAVCNHDMAAHADKLGIEPTEFRSGPAMQKHLKAEKRLTLVAGHSDTRWLDLTGRPNVILMHGVGFNFDQRKTLAGYPGTKQNRRNTRLMLSTNERIAQIEREPNPHIRAEVVGCPKLDRWHRLPRKPRSNPPVVVFAFHWECKICPESMNAWAHYKDILPRIAGEYKVLGHGHPHIIDKLAPQYEAMGIEVVRDLGEVFERADLMCFDATSAGYEFASLDRPVVVMNAPWYRRDVNFGLRFWEHADVGVQVNEPEQMIGAINSALADWPDQQAKRRAAVEASYSFTDGRCAERAATAILDILN